MKIFIDSSAFIALLASDQATHPEALRTYKRLVDDHAMFYTSGNVLDETCTWLLYKNGIHVAQGLNDMIRAAEKSGYLDVVWMDRILWEDAWPLFVKFAEHTLSVTDVTSYVLVKRFLMDGIFTFDSGFKKVGLSLLP